MLAEIPRPAGRSVRPRRTAAARRPGRRHRRHAARHAIWPAAGRAAGRQPGPGGLDDHQRPGPGIDAAAHRGALAAGGRTIAVLGSGVMNIYPPEHAKLADEVGGQGAVVSESPPRSQPLAGTFPQRNRIISGHVVGRDRGRGRRAERGADYRAARDGAGSRVFAVPGNVDSRTSRGCHRLIRDGAKLVESADDVLEELGPLVAAAPRDDGQVIHHPAELLLNELEQQVLRPSPARRRDRRDRGRHRPARLQVLSTLSVLEMRRLIRRLSGTRSCGREAL